jgi:hypothetical protein
MGELGLPMDGKVGSAGGRGGGGDLFSGWNAAIFSLVNTQEGSSGRAV